ncbi:hypothetical protein H0A36_17435 [Endozoicomonas sp. SM1973]|uniref:Uncharacterized protein n=1 Tax=Spartinivicinus marinus TaxID=2994442 RepID=A0A853I529_9GAMM|nr:hypothetical protein [Spartinivicinus marinus]MCX4030156.1 hypothetical protein [Spartinivicinus marinus]NYZ67799.1 hypothetical protein [Spartinivicinus marinus]
MGEEELFVCPLCKQESICNTGKQFIFEGIKIDTFNCKKCSFQIIGKAGFFNNELAINSLHISYG